MTEDNIDAAFDRLQSHLRQHAETVIHYDRVYVPLCIRAGDRGLMLMARQLRNRTAAYISERSAHHE